MTETNEGNTATRNLNTILLWVTLAGLGFIGATSYSNAVALAKIEGSLVTRAEIESKLSEIRTNQSVLEKDLVGIKLELAKIASPK